MTPKHPAKWSQPVLERMATIAEDESVRLGRPITVLDPFAGVGRPRLAAALGEFAETVYGLELQALWAADDELTVEGDATAIDVHPPVDAVITSPCYGNRMADKHHAKDPCKSCDGTGIVGDMDPESSAGDCRPCPDCDGLGVSKRNTYTHVLRAQGHELVDGSAAGMPWGTEYREFHQAFITSALGAVTESGLMVVNMSNHLVLEREQRVVEWWTNELLARACTIVQVDYVPTRRQRHGANGGKRVDGERIIVMRTPNPRRLL